MATTPRIVLNPKHPERTCWGCEKLCPASDLGCANGTIRTPHPVELFGEDWQEWVASREPGTGNPEPGTGTGNLEPRTSNLEPGTLNLEPSGLEPVPR